MSTNDNDGVKRDLLAFSAEAQGHAAIVLVESLIHGLIERSVLTVADAVEIIETAKEVQADVAEAADGDGAKLWQSHTLLSAMAASLAHDVSTSDRRPS